MSGETYVRYVALGDSQTEGVGDGDDLNGLRGFADRLAEQLAEHNPGLLYANLAVRGRLAGQIRAEQLDAALALKPDVATVLAGVNDLLRPKFEIDRVVGHVEAMFEALTGQGAQVATVLFPDIARIVPLARPLSGRVHAYNDAIRDAARRHGVLVAETSAHEVCTDARMWSADRLHASELGHQRISEALAEALDLPGSSDAWTRALPPVPARPGGVAGELRWLAGFLGPWLGRRLRGRSSGDGRVAKRPELLPVLAG